MRVTDPGGWLVVAILGVILIATIISFIRGEIDE